MNRLKNDILINQQLLEELLSNRLYKELIFSTTFKRLEKISFLGAIDYIGRNKKRFYRYEHSVSVGVLALFYAKLKKFNKKDTEILVSSALLHDIGHAPLSHSIEGVFYKKYNINHHKNGNKIILGENSLEIKNILNKYNINENTIVDILDKKVDNEISFILNNPINIDTIDGINRCYLSVNYRQRYAKLGFVSTPLDIVKALVEKDRSTLDQFWTLKDRMYNDFIHKPINLYADIFASDFIQQQRLKENDFNSDDKKLKSSYEKLFNELSVLNKKEVFVKLKYKKRKYYFDKKSIVKPDDLRKRYINIKYEEEIDFDQQRSKYKQRSFYEFKYDR